MDTRLTLKIDKEVIEQAKLYARRTEQSLSKIVENYFRIIVVEELENEEFEISPTVRRLSGILPPPDDQYSRDDYTDFLEKKYRS
jgi:hypothetical protein